MQVMGDGPFDVRVRAGLRLAPGLLAEEGEHFFGLGERLRSREGDGTWKLMVEGRRRRSYRLEAALSALIQPFVPCTVEWNGRALPPGSWSYDDATGLLRAAFGGRRGRLTVRACA